MEQMDLQCPEGEIEFLENTKFYPQWHEVLCITKLVPLFCVLPLGKIKFGYILIFDRHKFPLPWVDG